MKKLLLLALLLLGYTTQVWGGSGEVWLTITRTGHDSEGASTFERFEITPDGLARWETSAFGISGEVGCQNEGGSFAGRVTSQQALKLAKAARGALASQKRSKSTQGAHFRSSILSISVDVGKQVAVGQIYQSSGAVVALLAQIDALEVTLRPKALVVMQAVRSGNQLKISFDLAGNRPVTVLLPANAGEAFKVDNATLDYATAVPAELTLGVNSGHGEVVLNIEGGNGSDHVHYSNATGMHHASGDAMEGDRVAPELSLCTGLQGN